tara:strand:+ start:116 stop:334 length:219 start_codon:yes stop_codon:yes gene_type:complete
MLAEKLSQYLKKDHDRDDDHDGGDAEGAFKALGDAIRDKDDEDGLAALKAIIYECIDDHKSGGGLMIAIGKK